MNMADLERLVESLTLGFETLRDEYRTLFAQQKSLERKLALTRGQYHELAKHYGIHSVDSPPSSLYSSRPARKETDGLQEESVAEMISQRQDGAIAAKQVRAAATAAQSLRHTFKEGPQASSPEGVKIWSGPSADHVTPTCALMPPITESSLERDFTVEGKPSSLGCPFASMANKKLSSHAATVLSRYNARGSVGAAPSTVASSTSRINGKESLSRRAGRKASFVDPIKAEICGRSDHGNGNDFSLPSNPPKVPATEGEGAVEVGVCPIRFLDQHSPEEVAKFFEQHKHELPRSHEVCVRRYQSNEEQIRQLDAKYGNLVTMIQDLGSRHKAFLPEDPIGDAPIEDGQDFVKQDAKDVEKIRRWANSVSAQADLDAAGQGEQGLDADVDERQPHFERPLREVRLGESPSRPWGVPVPAKYLDAAPSDAKAQKSGWADDLGQETSKRMDSSQDKVAHPGPPPQPQPIFPSASLLAKEAPELDKAKSETQQPRMVFTGPVFIGYSAEDAAKILRGNGQKDQKQAA